MTQGTARLECWVVGALSFIVHERWRSHSYVLGWSPYPVSRHVGLGITGPSQGHSVAPWSFGNNLALDINVMADSDSMLDCQNCPESPLCSRSIGSGYQN